MRISNQEHHDARYGACGPRWRKQFTFEGDPHVYTEDEVDDVASPSELIELELLEVGDTCIVDGSLCERIEDGE